MAIATPVYAQGTLAALLASPDVTVPTRKVLQARLTGSKLLSPDFFCMDAFCTLQAVCARLIRPIQGVGTLDIAGSIDRMLQDGVGDGWRHDQMPPDQQAFQQGLLGIDESAASIFGTTFAQLEADQQDSVLQAVQRGEAPGNIWKTLQPAHFFEELLAAATEACYCQPLVQESIGYAGMADAPGWHAIGLNELETREPQQLKVLPNPSGPAHA